MIGAGNAARQNGLANQSGVIFWRVRISDRVDGEFDHDGIQLGIIEHCRTFSGLMEQVRKNLDGSLIDRLAAAINDLFEQARGVNDEFELLSWFHGVLKRGVVGIVRSCGDEIGGFAVEVDRVRAGLAGAGGPGRGRLGSLRCLLAAALGAVAAFGVAEAIDFSQEAHFVFGDGG